MPFNFNNTYARLPEAFHARLKPASAGAPELIRLNRSLAEDLGADTERLESEEGLSILSGNGIADGSEPLAMAYCGHQFGNFVPQLGDGRALLLGEVISQDGIRRDIQLKGSGPTPFSRRGDGLSALGPVLREYIVSEAMHAMGVPTTRALAAVASGDKVARENVVPGGVFTRIAKSHIRVGTFQWFAARRDDENLKTLADYVINRLYPEAHESDNVYAGLLDGVIQRQAELVAHWMSLGFIHGVMNTDNMNVSGETIDFGPCAFLDEYHPKKKFSSIDQQGRYAFANQGPIAHWNLTRFAETLLPLLDTDRDAAVKKAEASLDRFVDLHQAALRRRFNAKIGLAGESEEDWNLVQSLLTAMAEGKADFTLAFRHLPAALEHSDQERLLALFTDQKAITEWLAQWENRIATEQRPAACETMRKANPIYIPRNHRIEEVIEAAYQGDYQPFHKLNDVLAKPFTAQSEFEEYESPPTPDEVVCATFCGT